MGFLVFVVPEPPKVCRRMVSGAAFNGLWVFILPTSGVQVPMECNLGVSKAMMFLVLGELEFTMRSFHTASHGSWFRLQT